MRHTALIAALFLIAAPAIGQTTIHKWVDANGVTHYSEQPPASGKSTEIQPRVSRPPTPEAPAPATEEQAEKTPARDAGKPKNDQVFTMPADKLAEQCQQSRQRLQQLESSPRIMTRGEDGQMQRAPEEERQRMMEEERKRIELYCVE